MAILCNQAVMEQQAAGKYKCLQLVCLLSKGEMKYFSITRTIEPCLSVGKANYKTTMT